MVWICRGISHELSKRNVRGMNSILNNPSRYSRFLVNTGYRKATSTSVTPFILERKLSKAMKKLFNELGAYSDDIEIFENVLTEADKQLIMEMYEMFESESIASVLKHFFKKPVHIKIYERYNL